MAQQFNDKEKKQFYNQIEKVLDSIDGLKKTEIVRLNDDRLKLITIVISDIAEIKKHFNNSLLD